MPLITTSTMIFIGNQPLIDVDENDGVYENAGALAGSYDDLEMVDITNHDVTEDGVIWSDESGSGDFIEYTIDGVTYTSPQDAIIIYEAIITERDGTVHNVEVSVIQAPNGDTFVNDYGNQGTTDNLNIKTIQLTNPQTSGSAGRNTFATTENTAVCFGAGTLIATPSGKQRIETLRAGDEVMTWQGIPETIEWIGVSQFPASDKQAPVTLDTSAFADGIPSSPLVLSPQHRVLVQSKIVERMFGCDSVFVIAKNLVALTGVYSKQTTKAPRYWHILCARHVVLSANDLPAESLFPGPVAMRALPRAAIERINALKQADPLAFATPCRPVFSGPRQRMLIARHAKNNKPCVAANAPLPVHFGIGALACQNAFEPARLV